MVQLFLALGDGERAAFEAYAEVYPDDCLLLIDTVDTLGSGLPNAIAVFEQLRRRGHRPLGVRLDSGDLAYLAVHASRQLDAAGFDDATIVLSSQLDELAIWQILSQIENEAPRAGTDADHVIGRLTMGVGSRLATSHGDPSLDGVYKLVAVDDHGRLDPGDQAVGLTRQGAQPGRQDPLEGLRRPWTGQCRRVSRPTSTRCTPSTDLLLHHHSRPDVDRTLGADAWSHAEVLTEPVLQRGGGRGRRRPRRRSPISTPPAARRTADVDRLDPGVRRLVKPHRTTSRSPTSCSSSSRRPSPRCDERPVPTRNEPSMDEHPGALRRRASRGGDPRVPHARSARTRNGDGLTDTPARVTRSFRELLVGYDEDPGDHLDRQFEVDHDEMVMVRDIPFSSLCEHHLLPFIGKAHVVYVPGDSGRVCGLSKLARLVDGYAKRLQVQERMTVQIADELMKRLDAAGALGRDRGRAPVHDGAWGRQAGCAHHHVGRARHAEGSGHHRAEALTLLHR